MSQAAVYFHPDGYDTARKSLMGRHAAGEGFLRGLVKHSADEILSCVCENEAHARVFLSSVQGVRADAKIRWIRPGDLARLDAVGTVMLPGPDLAVSAWQRRRGRQNGHSLVGLTHTTASHRAMDLIAQMTLAPVQEWDALICTSLSVRQKVERLLQEQDDYLAVRLGAGRAVRPQLPVIPLGVDFETLNATRRHRGYWRNKLGIGQDDRVVLYFGRLSLHAKAHPSPMFAALQLAKETLEAGGDTGPVHLVLGGWFANDGQERMFREEAERLALGIRLHVVDGREAEARAGLWGVADIFTLLSDNIQETFGLAPIEAMAAGLPVVVSDWDGFKDTVEHGVQGFRIPTVTPPPGFAPDLAHRHEDGAETYDGYIAGVAQLCAVDVRLAAEAYAQLLSSAEVRRTMSEAAQSRAKSVFDWGVVIASYRELWADLAARRRTAEVSAPLVRGRPANPLRMDPTVLFSGHPTSHLSESSMLVPTGRASSGGLAEHLATTALAVRPAYLSPAEDLRAALAILEREQAPVTVAAIVSSVEASRRDLLFRSLVWLLKHDFVRIVSGQARDAPGSSAC